MTFNGLTGSDLIVFNALEEMTLPGKVSAMDIAKLTGHHPQTVCGALDRLEQYDIIRRHRENSGHPYTIDWASK